MQLTAEQIQAAEYDKQWGALAMRYWAEYRTAEFNALEDPIGFFNQIGETIENEILDTEDNYRRLPANHPDFMAKVADREQARRMATEFALDNAGILHPPAE